VGKTYPDQVRAAERAEARKKRRRWSASVVFVTIRMAELFRVFVHSYGGAGLPDDDAGRDDLKLMFQVLSTTHDAAHRMYSVARAWAPWMPADELAALVADVAAHPRRFKADTIAARLGITAEIRALLDLRTIGASTSRPNSAPQNGVKCNGRRKNRSAAPPESPRSRKPARNAPKNPHGSKPEFPARRGTAAASAPRETYHGYNIYLSTTL
jgi:hypothetical protein